MIFQDQMGFVINLDKTPQRIVSLVPSQTEFLCDIGLEQNLVGITKFCIHPESCYRSKTRVGGTKDFNIEAIRQLQPDIIIANKEENTESLVLQLREEFPVWISDVRDVPSALEMMSQLGDILNRKEQTQTIVTKITSDFAHLTALANPKTVAYLIWRQPFMSINKNTFIHDVLQRAGFTNVFASKEQDYPALTLEELAAIAPDLIFLSSEPYPFKEKHIAELQAICPRSQILLVDGEMFSWYGSRMLQTPAYLSKLQFGL